MREGVSVVFLRLVVDKDASFGVFQEALAVSRWLRAARARCWMVATRRR